MTHILLYDQPDILLLTVIQPTKFIHNNIALFPILVFGNILKSNFENQY